MTTLRTLALGGLLLVALSAAVPGLVAADSPPEQPGRSGVLRFEDVLSFFVIDDQEGLMSFHGLATPLAELCAGSPPVFDPLTVQLIFTPSGALHGLFSGSEHSVLVYPAIPPTNQIGPEDCPLLETLPLLAAGPSRIIRTDNDLTGFGGSGANSFGWQATGLLDDLAQGGQARYSEVVRAQVLPHTEPGPDEVEIQVLDIRLQHVTNP